MTEALRFALLGKPVAHSKSPSMHAAAYRALGMRHVYEAIECEAGDLAGLVAALRAGDFAGFNVTVPHKEAVLAHVDCVDPNARLAGAANTLVVRREERAVVAYNTDIPALVGELSLLLPQHDFRGSRALVLGAGGAARGVVIALALGLGVPKIVVRARSEERRARLVRELGASLRDAGAPTELAHEPLASSADDARISVVVQATSAGMAGNGAGDDVARAVLWEALAAPAVALDVVYGPDVTAFLRCARDHGLSCANGLGMLARQGAIAFSLWLGGEPPVETMRRALR